MPRRWLFRQAVNFSLWSVFAVYMVLQEHYTTMFLGTKITWRYLISGEFEYAYLWALLTPVMLWLADRFPLDQRGWYRMAPVHVVACLLLTSIQRSIFALLHPSVSKQWQVHDFASLFRLIVVSLDYGVMLYGIVLLVHYAVKYYARYQEGRLRTSQLEARLAQAQLEALKMQLQPHFLFNTLHSIATLVPEDPEAAETMIARLSELLRLSLENNGVQQVPLSKELEFIESYLGIERIRFAERMEVHFDISPDTLDAQVPNLILQPLVENAIHHGIGGGAGRIEIRSRHTRGKLILQVLDNGPGLRDQNACSPSGRGLGLANTRARLETIYGKEHDFVVRTASNGGVEAVILIPWKMAQPTSHDRNCKN